MGVGRARARAEVSRKKIVATIFATNYSGNKTIEL